jgi:hypothetical protein
MSRAGTGGREGTGGELPSDDLPAADLPPMSPRLEPFA